MSRQYPDDWNSRRKKVYRRDNYTCQNCGAKGGPYGDAELHAHHIVPKSKGGTHKLTNLKTMCRGCHDAIHGNRMAPTARGGSSGSAWDDVEPPSPGKVALGLMWWVAFIFATSVDLVLGGLVIAIWLWFKYKYKWSEDADTSSSSLSSSSTNPTSITSDVSISSSKPHSSHTEYGKYESSISTDTSDSDTGSNIDNIGGYDPDRDPYAWDEILAEEPASNESTGTGDKDVGTTPNTEEIDGYDPNRDPYAWDDTLSENTEPESELEEDDIGSAEGIEDQDEVPFDWYGDDEVPVEIVLDHIDTGLDPDTRQQIKQSVQKHRARGDAVDAADIRWVAEASEKLDLEGDHPF